MNRSIRIYRQKGFETITVDIYRDDRVSIRIQCDSREEVYKVIEEFWDGVVDSDGE